MSETTEKSLNFIEHIIEEDLNSGKHASIATRFPPEPNGYLHIGHAKSICLNFGLGEKYGGTTNLRFDDTNPEKESEAYVNAIKRDVEWLGFSWNGEVRYTSDYFQTLYEYALRLIDKGLAYVDEQSAEDIARQKGTPTQPGTNSPFRERSPEENRALFERMRAGEFEEGSHVLRAKIDMAHANMHMRDPFIYRIKKVTHHRTGDAWPIYPMYDFAHGQSDSIESITHSLCTLEFEVHRPLYEWLIHALEIYPSRQIEFARLNLNYTIMSKRKLLRLVEEGAVDGWDDPRMPTISGLRRRGYTPESIRMFCDKVGIAKRENIIDVALLEFAVRDHLNKITPRYMAVLDPVKLVITNYPEGQEEWLETTNNPEDESQGTRQIPFSRELWIERSDFKTESPGRKYFRLAPGKAVRLKSAYIIECTGFETDASGAVSEVHCTYVPNSKSGQDTSGMKVKGTIHFASAAHAADVEVRLYDRLFSDPSPDSHEGKDFMEFLNPDSLEVITAKAEPALSQLVVGDRVQFQRMGYFCVDSKYSAEGKPVFNRTSTLRDTWAKEQQKKG